MLPLRLPLLRFVPRQPRYSPSNRASYTIPNPLAQIIQLPLRLLLLALSVLPRAFLL